MTRKRSSNGQSANKGNPNSASEQDHRQENAKQSQEEKSETNIDPSSHTEDQKVGDEECCPFGYN